MTEPLEAAPTPPRTVPGPPTGSPAPPGVPALVGQPDARMVAIVQSVCACARENLELMRCIEELLDAHRKTAAIRAYVARAIQDRTLNVQAQNALAELRLRQERQIGLWLQAQVNHTGGGDRRSVSHDATPIGDLPLSISRTQSSRWQRLAAVPVDTFEQHLATLKEEQQELSTNAVLRLVTAPRQEPPEEGAQALASCTVADLQKLLERGVRFGTIYADPPWEYANRATRAAAADHYPTLSVGAIAALPIRELGKEEAHLHLWVTNAFLFECPRILDAWGFEFKSVFVWTKPSVGLGNYWRVAHEFLVLGVRGRCPFRDRTQRSWQTLERTEHSRKPEAVRRLIEQVSPGPYLELFGRHPVSGWVVWGNAIERSLFDGDIEHL